MPPEAPNIVRFLARQKLRFDLAQGFFAVANFAVIVIAASDKLAYRLGVSPVVAVAVTVPAGLVGVWFIGYVLDRARFYHAYQDEQNHRNAMLKDALQSTKPSDR